MKTAVAPLTSVPLGRSVEFGSQFVKSSPLMLAVWTSVQPPFRATLRMSSSLRASWMP